jgi:hypothetical protein
MYSHAATPCSPPGPPVRHDQPVASGACLCGVCTCTRRSCWHGMALFGDRSDGCAPARMAQAWLVHCQRPFLSRRLLQHVAGSEVTSPSTACGLLQQDCNAPQHPARSFKRVAASEAALPPLPRPPCVHQLAPSERRNERPRFHAVRSQRASEPIRGRADDLGEHQRDGQRGRPSRRACLPTPHSPGLSSRTHTRPHAKALTHELHSCAASTHALAAAWGCRAHPFALASTQNEYTPHGLGGRGVPNEYPSWTRRPRSTLQGG